MQTTTIVTGKCLAKLLNGTTRRPQTVQSYIAPPQLRGTVHPCLEWPNGVYINIYGKIEPDHHLTGTFNGDIQTDDDDEEEVLSGTDEEEGEGLYSDDEVAEGDDEYIPSDASESDVESEVEEMVSEDQKDENDLGTEAERADMERLFQKAQQMKQERMYQNMQIDLAQGILDEWEQLKDREFKNYQLIYKSQIVSANPFFYFRIQDASTVFCEVQMDMGRLDFVCSTCTHFRFKSLADLVSHQHS